MKIVKMFCAITITAGIVAITQGAQPSDAKQQQLSHAQIRIAVQEICPVTGQKLGSHGTPLAAKIGKEEVFLCCKGCATGKINPQHWATIHANFAKAQGICPVMKDKLPKQSKWTVVQGQIFYVCCPPCIKKIEADPKTFLKQLDELYLASLKQRKQLR